MRMVMLSISEEMLSVIDRAKLAAKVTRSDYLRSAALAFAASDLAPADFHRACEMMANLFARKSNSQIKEMLEIIEAWSKEG
jgi:hypothetical protein